MKTMIIGGVILLLALITLISTCNVVDQGNVGLLVQRTGTDKGTAKVEEKSGWVFVTPFTERLYEYATYQQHKEYDELEVLAKGGLLFKVKPTFNYELNRSKVVDLFQQYRRPLNDIEDGWMKTAVYQVFRDVTNTYDPDSLINNRGGYEATIYKELQKKLLPYFTVSQVTSNLSPPESLIKAIEAKSRAVQDAQTAENQKRVIVAEGEKQVAQARADSSARVTRAAGQARENQLLQISLSPALIQKMWIDKWDGVLPTYQLGSGSNMMLSLPPTQNK